MNKRMRPLVCFFLLGFLLTACSDDTVPAYPDGGRRDAFRFGDGSGEQSSTDARVPGDAAEDFAPTDISGREAGIDQGVPDQRVADGAPDQSPVDQGADTWLPGCVTFTADGLPLNAGCDPDVQSQGIDAISGWINGADHGWFMLSGKKWWYLDHPLDLTGTFKAAGKDIAADLQTWPPTDCTLTTTDGLELNPGCDPTVQSEGISALEIFEANGAINSFWFNRGTHWWFFDGSTNQFSMGGKDVAGSFVAGWNPTNCTDQVNGFALNPGCDADVQASGIHALSQMSGLPDLWWLFNTGKKWWAWDATQPNGGAFTQAGPDIALTMRTTWQPTDCSAVTINGFVLNPGCDADVQSDGFTAMSSFIDGTTTTLIFIQHKKWWLWNSQTAQFVDGGEDISTWFRSRYPQ